MRFRRIISPAALVVCTVVILVASAAAASASKPSLPQPVSAQAGATWLGSQFTAQGYIPSSGDSGTADLSATANSILALASANVDPATAATALSYMEDNVDTYVTQEGADGPGQLALLILDAHALGVDPTSFGGTDLVSRLLATQQASGPQHGNVRNPEASSMSSRPVSTTRGWPWLLWLRWVTHTARRSDRPSRGSSTSSARTAAGPASTLINNPCNGSPADFEGPDTNSTSLAIQGLSAAGRPQRLRPQQGRRVSRRRARQRRRLGVRAEHHQHTRFDRPRLDGARPPSHPRHGVRAEQGAVQPERESGFGVGVVSDEFWCRSRGIQLSGHQRTEHHRHVPGGSGGCGCHVPLQLVRDDDFPAGGNGQPALQGQAHGQRWERSVHVVPRKGRWDATVGADIEQLNRQDHRYADGNGYDRTSS